jgi:asparagine synthase (glutamine-hydrolysing)
MCGIAGILNFDGTAVDKKTIESMTNTLSHRGPDGNGVYCSDSIGLGHSRLSIFDLSTAGAQPMTSDDGRYTIVYNGEVYNWPEIREQLSFNKWRSKTDTETVLYAFIEKGEDCLSLFNGMFAFAIWDKKERKLLLARDRVGIKPLFFGFHNNSLYFASEVKAMFSARFPKIANTRTIYDFLRWGLIDYSSDSFFQNIHSMKPGCFMLVDKNNKTKEVCYWNLADIVKNQSTVDMPNIVDEYSELLTDSIDIRLRSDVPVGVFLSGGIDSSILASRLVRSFNKDKLKAYTYEFDTGSEGEGEYAKETAGHLGLESHIIALGNREVPDYFEKALYNQEMPITSIRCLASQKLYEVVKASGTTVILEGHGGDQIGGGFEYYFVPHIMDVAQEKGTDEAFKLLGEFLQMYKIPKDAQLKKLFDCLSAYSMPGTSTQDGISYIRKECLLSDFINAYNPKHISLLRPFNSRLLNAQYIDLCNQNLPRVLRYTDRESMASGCEARVPFLDHRIVELGFRASVSARINGTKQRHFIKCSESNFLPDEILQRPKRSIVDPQRRWLQNEIKDWVADIFHSKSFGERGIFNQKAVIKEFERYCKENKPITGFHIFQYLNIELWFRTIIDNRFEENN